LDLLCDRAAGLFVYAVATVAFLETVGTQPDEQYAVIARSPNDTSHEGGVNGVHGGLSLDSLCTSIFQTSFPDSANGAVVCLVLSASILSTPPLPLSTIPKAVHLEKKIVMDILRSIYPLLEPCENPDLPVRKFHKLVSDYLTNQARCPNGQFLCQEPMAESGILYLVGRWVFFKILSGVLNS
jgi:hypothetical protein